MKEFRKTKAFQNLRFFSAPFRLFIESRRDRVRFRKASFYFSKHTPTFDNIRGELAFESHALEKGLLHSDFRPRFGRKRIQRIFELLKTYRNAGYPEEDSRYRTAISVLNRYIERHAQLNIDLPEYSAQLKQYPSKQILAGTQEIDSSNLLKLGLGNFEMLSKGRHSIRQFDKLPVRKEQLLKALKLCERTPSVCNRQAWKVYILRDESAMNEVLVTQAGINGMAKNVSAVAVITVDESYMGNLTERNQAYIDGGIYTMNLLNALTYIGLGSCALNADFNMKTDKKMRRLIPVASSEVFIAVVAIGNYPESVVVPVSNRDKFEEYVTFL